MQNTKQNFDIPLHDIKPILDIQEYSFYYLLGAGILVLIVILGIAYLIYKWVKAKNAYSKRKEDIKSINELNLSNTKNAAYMITLLGATFKDDSQRHAQMYANLVQRLESYKYKKEVDEFDSEVKGYIDVYKEMIDV
ncbi:MAG: hypothetical protein ACJAWW_001689 [Sulfurimonas sp.]|jgi:hypothetical protein